ncbi:MAG: signal peptidase I [Dehalococcoidia bacterium]
MAQQTTEPEDSPPSLGAWGTASPDRPPDAGPPESPEPPESFSHGGLTSEDPWAAEAPWHRAVWPWGLGGVVETLDVIILALAMFVCVRFVAHNYVVDGGSMLPTFEHTDFLIVNRLAYRSFDLSWVPGMDEDDWRPFGEPQSGDVIVFEASANRDFIKRVVGLPGQTVELRSDVVYVDGVALDEPYTAEHRPGGVPGDYPPIEVEPGHVFVLGDNRDNSQDSRSIGQVEYDQIIGRADIRYWPWGRVGMIDHTLGAAADAAASIGRGVAALWR